MPAATAQTTHQDRPAGERILSTAHDLFYRDGIRATGIDRVIQEAGVTKVTFYRYFPSKNDLIRAFLVHRHERWMAWFSDALLRHGADIGALVPALGEWLRDPGYRGCAFINSVSELGRTVPEVADIARRHKREMVTAIAALLPPSRHRTRDAQALGLVVDGAIVQAQFADTPDDALAALRTSVSRLTR